MKCEEVSCDEVQFITLRGGSWRQNRNHFRKIGSYRGIGGGYVDEDSKKTFSSRYDGIRVLLSVYNHTHQEV